MTLDDIKQEMSKIRILRRTDLDTATERWESLNNRVHAYLEAGKYPNIWRKVFLNELTM